MKTFLVPVDFSPVTSTVIDTALGFCAALGGRVVLLHVVQPPIVTGEYALPVEVLEEAVAASENAARRNIAKYEQQLRTAGVETESVLRQGPPVALILEEATRAGADYIVMGSHGHGKLYDFLVGSTASGVIKKAKCGVIILPPSDKS